MVPERSKLSSFGVRGWLNVSLNTSGDHTSSFHVAWGDPIWHSKGWRWPTKWNGVGSEEEFWGFSVIAAKPVYSTNKNAISPKGLSDATYHGLKFPSLAKLGKWVKGFQSHGMCRNLKQGSICICLVVDILGPNEVIWTSVAYLPRVS